MTGLSSVNQERGSSPQSKKMTLGKLRVKGEFIKLPSGTVDPEASIADTRKLPQSLIYPRAVSSAPVKDSPWEYEAVLFVPQTPVGKLARAQ